MYFHPSYTKYYVNEKGEIYNSKTNKQLKGTLTSSGYRISIREKGQYPKSLAASRFIWEAYNNQDTSFRYEKIIHIDGNKLNNKPSNLKMVDTGKLPSQPKKLFATNIATGKVLGDFDTIYEASKYLKINPGSIKLIADGKRKTATFKRDNNKYTFKWRRDDGISRPPCDDKIKQKIIALISDKARADAAKLLESTDDSDWEIIAPQNKS